MRLLQLLQVTQGFCRCACCGNLSPYSFRAYDRGAHSTGDYCMRCYQLLHAVQVFQPNLKGGE